MINYNAAALRHSFDQTDDQAIWLPGHPHKQRIKLSEVLYIAGFGNYVTFHLVDRTTIVVAYTLSSYASLPGFLRIHKSSFVNIRYVASIRSNGRNDGRALLNNGVELSISRRRIEDVMTTIRSDVAIGT
ncbi:LytR/AlgR family response regulator transcription factor [Spirosoma utsteinense]|uniref:DNA-binding LytR/AlgR family response regulator n=1 Tax=Spirosoma utsteinense TaxID=2585773 RepID=A0ABR6WDE2_9BACT|nr:DNA-binding LytR/AlgR family response regulator [Spirosoma utsteinense]MBC3794580.1 DNA-binding LytR/AlgR family response regulator [Spirosoma utsteinense]